MVRLIVNSLFLVLMAVLVAMNVANKTTINLFGKQFEEVSVIVVILLSMVAGVLYSLLFFTLNRVLTFDRERWRDLKTLTKQKEKELESKERNLDRLTEQQLHISKLSVDRDDHTQPELQTLEQPRKTKTGFSLFKRPKEEK